MDLECYMFDIQFRGWLLSPTICGIKFCGCQKLSKNIQWKKVEWGPPPTPTIRNENVSIFQFQPIREIFHTSYAFQNLCGTNFCGFKNLRNIILVSAKVICEFHPNPTMEQLCFRKVSTRLGLNMNFEFGEQYDCD